MSQVPATCSDSKPDGSSPLSPIIFLLGSILILFFYLPLGPPGGLYCVSLPAKPPLGNLISPHICYMPCPIHRFDLAILMTYGKRVEILKLQIMQFLSALSHLLPATPK